jgi:hypothetical protein
MSQDDSEVTFNVILYANTTKTNAMERMKIEKKNRANISLAFDRYDIGSYR